MTTGPIRASFGSVDPLLVLLAQQVATERENQRHEDTVRVVSRNAKLAADQAAVQALHEKADAIRTGAWVSLAVTTAGAATEGAGILTAPGAGAEGETAAQLAKREASSKLSCGLSAGGRALSGMSEPAGKLFGDANATEADARSVSAKSRADDAENTHDASRSAKQKSEAHVNAMIDQVQRIIESARQAIDHVLSRF